MRLLILTQYYPPEIGAPQTRLAALAREMKARGHDVEVVTAMPHHLAERTYKAYRRRLYLREEIDGVIVQRTWILAATGTGLRRLLSYLSFACTCSIALARARPADAIFVESPPLFLGIPAWIAARRRKALRIFNVSDLWPDSVRELGVLRDGLLMRAAYALETWIYRRADIVNAVTDGIARTLRERKGVPGEKIRALPNGVDLVRFAPRPRDVELARRLGVDERPLFIYAGTHGIAQGLLHLVDAAALIGDRANLLFVGAGPVKEALRERARARGLRNVHFAEPAPLEQMPRYFSLAYAAIVPLVRTPLMHGARPSKMFPALASGVPVIFSGEGESATLLRDADAGVVVAPEDPRTLADAMANLIAEPERRERLARGARALASERFSWSSIIDRWLESLPPSRSHST